MINDRYQLALALVIAIIVAVGQADRGLNAVFLRLAKR